jgi:hypothetical protein
MVGAKDEWVRRQELGPMYDWIEENIGDDARGEDSEKWDLAVKAYEDYCAKQQRRLEDEEAYLEAELEWYLHTKSPVGIFNSHAKNVRELLSVEVSNNAHFSLLVMLHGHVVASVEAYLASTFMQTVTESDYLIRRLVESDPVFSKTKFTLKEIYEKHENLKLTVAKYLKDLIFHELSKVKPMFKSVLNCDFGDIRWLFIAVETRHHCVHRAGLDKNGDRVDISFYTISQLLDDSSELVKVIEYSLGNEDFLFIPF